MNSEHRFWLSFWAIIGTTLVALVIGGTLACQPELARTAKLRDHCITEHGNWTGGQCRFYAEAAR